MKELGLHGKVTARDVWAGKDLGRIGDDWRATIADRAVELLIVHP